MPQLRILVAASVLLFGCDGGEPTRPDGSTGEQTTYYADIAPLVARECLGCHVAGGIGPFELDSFEEVEGVGESVVGAVMVGYMPPWMPDPECQTYEHQRGLSMAERQVFERWLAQGMLEGDPADEPEPPPPPPTLEATDVARMAEPYTPNAALPDDYRCFVMDHTFTTDSFMTGSTVMPDAQSLVHHVLVYAAPPSLVAAIEAADAADPGPGYTCFGGPVPNAGAEGGSLGMVGLGGWVPGAVPNIARDGQAMYVPAGSRVVMQIHYNLLSEDPRPDMTEFHMELTSEAPTTVLTTFPLAIQDLDIRAGVAENVHRRTFRNYRSEPMRLIAFTPHMHLLGTSIRAHRVPSTGEDQCLVDVPQWDFNWQQGYRLTEADTVVLAPGEGIELECVYDNSDTNQPVVNGMQVEPRDVSWGEGTLDEMCLLYVQEEAPWTGPPPATDLCEPAAACLSSCATDDAQCLLSCEAMGIQCRICTMESTLGCAQSACLASYAPAAGCFDTCIQSWALIGGSFDACMEAECPRDSWAPARDCVAGVLEAGTCDSMLTACGITR